MEKNLDFYVKKIPNFLSKDTCNQTIKQIKNLEWQEHTFYDAVNKKTKKISGEQELEVSYNNDSAGVDSTVIMGKLWFEIDNYIKDYKFDWFNSWQGYTKIRFNRYAKNKKMAEHCDHINSIFDGERKGIPVLSIVGVLNENYEGGEFIMFKDKEIKMLTGDLLIFPSVFLYPHKVNPVKKGTRYSFVSWMY
jgi:predicted 2-oxoglutarate/Fe(II)-dependent dioxygenase YbiX